ncbi:hypothetical protein MBH78_15395 [Oceanimonas sp. NS1]|nr:hypothetical protein [Oceanimonas sp. NS1]
MLARFNCGVAPRREYKDLKWRYWDNPYKEHLTMVVDEGDFKGYAIVSFQPRSESSVCLEDFSTISNSEADNLKMFNRLIGCLKQASIRWVTVNQSSDSYLVETLSKVKGHELLAWKFANRVANKGEDKPMMPRKITKRGEENRVELSGWDATALVFEGRL